MADRYVYVTRLPVVQKSKTYVGVQRPSRGTGYHTAYPGWFLQRTELVTLSKAVVSNWTASSLCRRVRSCPAHPNSPNIEASSLPLGELE